VITCYIADRRHIALAAMARSRILVPDAAGR